MFLPAEHVTGNPDQFLFLALLFFLTGLFTPVKVHPGCLVPRKEHQGNIQRAAVPYFQAFTTDIAGSSSFSIERIAAALRCSSEPKCPRSFNPLGTKCSTQMMQVLYIPASRYNSSMIATLSASSLAHLTRSAMHLSLPTEYPHIGNNTCPCSEQWRADALCGTYP